MSAKWQPAICFNAHRDGLTDRSETGSRGRIRVRIKPTTAGESLLSFYRSFGCTAPAEKFYEVHPEDVAKVAPELYSTGGSFLLCEHEILTD